MREKSFQIRGLPQNIPVGTAGDRQAGRLGQIHTLGPNEKRITRNGPLTAGGVGSMLPEGFLCL
jgi:hypothetical protein